MTRRSRGLELALCLLVLVATPGAQEADVAAQASRARAAMEGRRFEEAASIYAALVKRMPEHAGLRLNLGLALHSAGDFARAAAEFERAATADPSLTPAWLMLGLTHLKLGRPERAVPPLERVIAVEPGHPLARLELADAHLQLGRFPEAAGHFETLVRLEPRSPTAWLGLGRSHAAIARTAFEHLEGEAPGSAYWSALLARSRAAQQQYRSAFQLYRQALAIDPSLRGAHAAIAEIYRRTDRHDWAAEELRREEALPPPDCTRTPLECAFLAGRHGEVLERTAAAATPDAWYWRSLAASERALEAFATLEALPPSPEVHALRAEAFAIRGLHDREIAEWRAALGLAPQDARLRRGLALAHWRNQDYTAARPLLEAALRAEPASAALLHALGDTLLQLQLPEDAVTPLAEAVRRDPGLTAARVALARAHARLGQWEAARPHLEATLEADEDGGLHVLLGRAYAAVGRTADSERLMERAQALGETARARRARVHEDAVITPP